MNNTLTLKKIALFAVILLVIGLILLVIFDRLATKTIYIQSEPNAVIYVSSEKGGEFIEIGVGTATFKTKQTSPIYARASSDGKSSVVTINPGDSVDETINIDLKGLKQVKKILDSPLKDYLIEKRVAYGVSPTTNSLVNAGLDNYVPLKIGFVGLPFMGSIVWENPNNFLYETYNSNVGAFINGSDKGSSYFKSSDQLTKLTQYRTRPIAFLGTGNIFISSGIGSDIKPIANIESSELNYFSSDNNHIYYVSYSEPSFYASEDEAPDSDKNTVKPAESRLQVFDYDGKTIMDVVIPETSSVNSVTYLEDLETFIAASDTGLKFIEKNSLNIETQNIYFNDIHDLLVIKNNIYFFSANGVWSYNKDNNTSYLSHDYEGEETYVVNSINPNPESVGFTTTNGIYEIDL